MPRNDGALAQLGERLHGMQEVSGSIPLGSTNLPCRDRLPLVVSKCFSARRPASWHNSPASTYTTFQYANLR